MSGSSNLQAASSGSVLSPIEEIIEEMQNGRMVILVDAEDRENEGDLIVPAQMATPDAINFMAKYGRGLVCLSLTQARANELNLDFMVRHNGSRNRTAFTASIEAREGISTGISAFDRARTIATAIDPTKGANDIVSPGHVFPLIAREGGVLVRAGHTEASIDLAKLAGLNPSAVICEVMNEDGTMARMADLAAFAQFHNLKIGAIEDLIAYRLKNDRIVKRVAQAPVQTTAGDFNLYVYDTTVEPGEHLALVKGDVSKGGPVLVRVHAVNVLSDVLGVDQTCEDGSAIAQAMRAVEADGRGVIVLIRDLRPKSVSEWVSRRTTPGSAEDSSKERRQVEIGVGSQILADLGVKDMVLLTTSPQHVYVGLEAFGLRVTGTRKIE
ncbi:3,4-dihydroxy-2-butanone-4-phosphate synthase [Hyphomicrobium sp.]|jgi:3,4-dihydroxy 2-butanone 4-phosphate synthase/GTP cyclohydrolase II|uniref:3,4-dihydroxy-2-butanone-4-phosphate synthase n=1 Tax=Hyphomicrobium sp. TaxID=82 RepID=UPI003567B281